MSVWEEVLNEKLVKHLEGLDLKHFPIHVPFPCNLNRRSCIRSQGLAPTAREVL